MVDGFLCIVVYTSEVCGSIGKFGDMLLLMI
jgi:hypothetical protein